MEALASGRIARAAWGRNHGREEHEQRPHDAGQDARSSVGQWWVRRQRSRRIAMPEARPIVA